jgi:hypothetical protein
MLVLSVLSWFSLHGRLVLVCHVCRFNRVLEYGRHSIQWGLGGERMVCRL